MVEEQSFCQSSWLQEPAIMLDAHMAGVWCAVVVCSLRLAEKRCMAHGNGYQADHAPSEAQIAPCSSPVGKGARAIARDG